MKNISRIILFVFATFGPVCSWALPDGLYAVFNTSLGSFTGRLDYAEAPLTVGNFVGLAEGTQPWLNEDNGLVMRNRFFDGLVFHRVVPGFVIQGGAHDGTGTGGPGYRFGDEFHPSLRHNKAMIMSMANSGPWSNGSQFFITLAQTASLDDKHSVFGEIISGSDVVQAIGAVDSGVPNYTNVVINAVTIIREGAAAEAFEADHPDLPDVGPLSSTVNPIARELAHPRDQYSRIYLSSSTNLMNESGWGITKEYFHLAVSDTNVIDLTAYANGSERTPFYSGGEVQYNANAFQVPEGLAGQDLRIDLTSGFAGGAVIMRFLSETNGIMASNFTGFESGDMHRASYRQDLPFMARMNSFLFSNGFPLSSLNLAFPQTPTNGPFSGTLGGTSISGTFFTRPF